MRVRNVRRYPSANVQPPTTIKVAEIPTSKRQSPKKLEAQRSRFPACKLLIAHLRLKLFEIWKLEFGFSRAVIRSAALDRLRELQLWAAPLGSVLLGSLSSIG